MNETQYQPATGLRVSIRMIKRLFESVDLRRIRFSAPSVRYAVTVAQAQAMLRIALMTESRDRIA